MLTYAGYEVVHLVADPSSYEYVGRWWDLNAPDLWTHPGYQLKKGLHLPIPQAPPRLKPKLNTLYWPTGASRWAVFHGLVTAENARKIRELTDDGGLTIPQTLAIESVQGDETVVTDMFLLALRPLAMQGAGTYEIVSPDGDLTWMTLVDARYYWWLRQPTFAFVDGSSWTTLLTNLITAATGGSAVIDAIDASLGKPDFDRWSQPGVGLPLLIDAVCQQTGRRFTRQLDGTMRVWAPDNAKIQSETNYDSSIHQDINKSVVLGGHNSPVQFNGAMPEALSVGWFEDQSLVGSQSLAGLGITDAAGVANTRGWFVGDLKTADAPAGYVHDIADNWYKWLLYAKHECVYNQIVTWVTTGLEDRVEYEYEHKHGIVATRIVRPNWADRNVWGTTPDDSKGKTYIVKLTGSGTGIEGGTAWAGKIQVENGLGSVVDNGYIGADSNTATYCMYKTKSYDGSPGTPEINDIVIAVPDKDRPGVWEFIPKMVSGAECQDCCWFADMATNACVTIQQLGGEGRCGTVPSGGKVSAIYIPNLGGWMALEMGTLACGCGGTIFKPSLQPDGPTGECTAAIELKSYHVSCVGGSGSGSGSGGESILDGTMLLSCCGRDDETGEPFAIFVGWGAGPCGDVPQTNCDNTFRIKVQCAPCPTAPCVCSECETCCEGTSPFGYYALMTNFSDQRKNGWWIWRADEGENCVWTAICGEGSGAYISQLDALPQPGGANTIWRLIHQGSVYESDLIIDCCDTILLNRVSGDGPAYVQLQPIKLDGECPECLHVWPETLTFTVTNIVLTGGASIGFHIGDTFTLTKLDPPPGLSWDTTVGWGYNYTSPVLGVAQLRFRCVDQVAACRGFTIQGIDSTATFSFCLGVGASVTPCADSPPDSVSTLIDCTCSPVYFEGTDYEKCLASPCPFGPLNSTVFIQGTVTE